MGRLSRTTSTSRSALGDGFAILVLTLISVVPNTSFHAPPRYDGAGYAVLGWSMASGLGYREGSHPDLPRHTHFPPGYPLVLSALFRSFGPSNLAAHWLSVGFTLGATLAYWRWFRRFFAPGRAFLIGAALAINWAWGRAGGAIQSEPMFNLLSALALLAASEPRVDRPARSVFLGALLGACILTRHVGVCLAGALILDLILKRQFTVLVLALATTVGCLAPWVVWIQQAGRGSQASLFEATGLISLLGHQALFYVRRIPDQLLGPFVEIATIYHQRPRLAFVATSGACLITAIVVLGWFLSLRSRRRRVMALVPSSTMLLLLVWPFTEAGRFLVPLVPFLIVGATEGLTWLTRRLGVPHARHRTAWLLLLLSLPYPIYAIAARRSEAQRQTHRHFDSACAWIARSAPNPGPVLTHYPADLFWQSGRPALETSGDDPASIDALIDRYRVAYLLINESAFTNAPADPLTKYVQRRGERVRLVWGPQGAVSVYGVIGLRRP